MSRIPHIHFHFTHSDTVVIGVPDDLVLNLLPALQRLVYQDLGGVSEGRRHQRDQLLAVVGESRAKAAECKRRADQDGVAEALCRRRRLPR